MAKGAGSAGRSEKNKSQSGLPRDWLFTGITGDKTILTVSPNGEIYDVVKVVPDVDEPMHSDATFKIRGLLGQNKFPNGWYSAGWSDVRLWSLDNGTQRTVQMQIPKRGQAGLREAQRIIDQMVNKGMNIRNLGVDVGVGWDLDSDEFTNRWDGDIGEFMSASNWRDLG